MYRDKIYGDVYLNDFEMAIIDTPEFQRLDDICQLGLAKFVYRGAKHTRFEHSVGVLEQASRIVDAIRRNSLENNDRAMLDYLSDDIGDDIAKFSYVGTLARLTALLHDITHIPFGHTLEDEFKDFYTKHDSLISPRLCYLLFDERSHISNIFETRESPIKILRCNKLKKLVYLILKYKAEVTENQILPFKQLISRSKDELKKHNGKSVHNKILIDNLDMLSKDFDDFSERRLFAPFLSDICSNTICADLFDYIKRDVDATGVHHVYDERIFKYLMIGKDAHTGLLRLALRIKDKKAIERSDAVSAILNVMQIRYALAESVYYHRVKVVASAMLSEVLNLIGKPEDSNPYESEDSVLKMGEYDLFQWITKKLQSSDTNKDAQQLFDMLRKRRIYKPCLILPKHYAWDVGAFQRILEMLRESDDARAKREEIQRKLSVSTGKKGIRALLYCPPRKMQAKEIDTPALWRTDAITPLKHQYHDSAVASRIRVLGEQYENLWKLYLFIHPDDIQEKNTVNVVITKLCDILELDPEGIVPYCPHGYDTPSIIQENLRQSYRKHTKRFARNNVRR